MVATPSRTEASHRSSNSVNKRNHEEDETANESNGVLKRMRTEDESDLESEQEDPAMRREARRQLKESNNMNHSAEEGKMDEVAEPQ